MLPTVSNENLSDHSDIPSLSDILSRQHMTELNTTYAVTICPGIVYCCMSQSQAPNLLLLLISNITTVVFCSYAIIPAVANCADNAISLLPEYEKYNNKNTTKINRHYTMLFDEDVL